MTCTDAARTAKPIKRACWTDTGFGYIRETATGLVFMSLETGREAYLGYAELIAGDWQVRE